MSSCVCGGGGGGVGGGGSYRFADAIVNWSQVDFDTWAALSSPYAEYVIVVWLKTGIWLCSCNNTKDDCSNMHKIK